MDGAPVKVWPTSSWQYKCWFWIPGRWKKWFSHQESVIHRSFWSTIGFQVSESGTWLVLENEMDKNLCSLCDYILGTEHQQFWRIQLNCTWHHYVDHHAIIVQLFTYKNMQERLGIALGLVVSCEPSFLASYGTGSNFWEALKELYHSKYMGTKG